MLNETPSQTIGRRYLVHELLGSGGMGAVYRATDRLNGQNVALKRVTTPTTKLKFGTHSGDYSPDIALAQEFKTLASLRHPNIVSVLDYGFDAERKPFFSMTLLQDAQKITEAGSKQPLEKQIDLLIQMLQALAYLHRRGILHRDLKPANVMVVEDQIKVLDFGLSQQATPDSGSVSPTTAGTFAYMAPELLQDVPATTASDLYAFGMIAYEVFAGRYPFRNANMAVLMMDVLNASADVFSIGIEHELALVLQRLLVKKPDERYHSAHEVMRDLCRATKLPPPRESIEIRESFLQAAKFVGRESEMAQLVSVLNAAQEGRGSTWLIGGESGVGKSRLVDELRTLALVQGLLVLRGQAVSEGGDPYQPWRSVLHSLALAIDLQEDEASVLKSVIPDISELLQRDVPDAPALEPQAAQSRLFNVVRDVFRRANQPALLILEDFQWAGSNSLALLQHLNQTASELPLLIVVDYRDDERSDLVDELPGVNTLKLERLTRAEVAELSASMLDESGRRPHIVQLLHRETEGNPLFLVEVVRALAEEAGELDQVGTMTLPQYILTGGLQRLVQRRLNQVPARYQRLLQVAAVAGRVLDLKLLNVVNDNYARNSEDPVGLDEFLQVCTNAAVLEVADDRWRFAHDKLRTGLLADLMPDLLVELHTAVALAIEEVYPYEAARLAYHWSLAGDAVSEAYYAHIAGDQALISGANVEAKAFFEQALNALSRLAFTDERREQSIDLAIKLSRVGAYLPSENILTRLQEALESTHALGDEARRAHVLGSTGAYYFMTGQTGQALTYFGQSMQLAERLNLPELLVLPYNIIGRALAVSGDLPVSEQMLAKGIPLAEEYNDLELLSGSLAMYGTVVWLQGRSVEAAPHIERALKLSEQIGLPSRIAGNLMTIGFCYTFGGDFDQAIDTLQHCLEIAEQTQDLHPIYMSNGCLGAIHLQRGEIDRAREYLNYSVQLAQQNKVLIYVPLYMAYQAEVMLLDGEREAAHEVVQQALALARQSQQRLAEGEVLRILSHIHMDASDWAQAETALQDSLTLFQQSNAQSFIALCTFDLAKMFRTRAQMQKASQHLDKALEMFQALNMDWHMRQAQAMKDSL